MATFRDEVADPAAYGESRRRFREYCQSWRSHQRRTAIENVVRLAVEDDRADDLYEVLLDDDYRALRQSLSGAAALRADLEAGREYFSSGRPDLLRYMQIAFAGQEASGELASLDGHRRNCQEFSDFLQLDRLPAERLDIGLHRALARFFPVSGDVADRPNRVGGRVTIRLAGYELGEWACSCGREAGLSRRYDYACQCDLRCGNGRLAPGEKRCPGCGYAPAYARCAECGTRVTLTSLWLAGRGGADPSAYRVPLTLELVIGGPDAGEQAVQFTLMQLPVPLGLKEHDGRITFGLPDLLWLGSFSGGPDASRFVSLSDQPRYDGRDGLRKVLEAAFRRTLWGRGRGRGYQAFGNDLLKALTDRYVRPADLTAKYTRGFERRIGRNIIAKEQASGNLARFGDIAVDCQVAASSSLRDRAVLVNRELVGPGGLSAPHRLDLARHLGKFAKITGDLPGLAPDRRSALDQWGLVSPGQLVEPRDVLVGIAIPADLTPEERLLSAIFGDKGTPLKDASMIMTGERPGRILNVTLRLRPGMGDAIPAGPGRVIERIGARESPQVVVSIAVDQPVEAGDVLFDDSGSEAIVVGIFGGAALRAKAGSHAEPDLVVAPRHPWAPVPGDPSLRTVRVRLRNETLAGTTIRSRARGEYEPLTLQPLGGTADGSAQTLVSADYYWLIAHGARHLAYEMYGPRCDYLEWRARLAGVLASRGKGVELPRTVTRDWASLQDSPSQAVRRWDMLMRSACILPRLDPEQMTLQLMTGEDALSGSHGEITEPETINRRTLKPEKDGLFCEKAFGPVQDWECYCGKYKTVKFEGVVCERCGVEVTRATVRHERLGHIELPVPVVHSWYLHGPAATRLAALIGVDEEELRAIVYCARGVVTNPGTASFHRGQVIDLDQWMAIRRDQTSPGPFAATGGEALRFLLQQAATHQDTAGFEGIIIQKLPILPAGMRPTEIMSSGTERTYAPNPLYLGVLRNARRLRRLIDWASPELIVMNERAQLQSAVDRLLDNARQPDPTRRLSGEEVPSLADLLAQQKWAFLRRSLDYSASTLLVTGDTSDPDVALLPARLAFDLFEPLIVSAMVHSGAAPDLASAQEHVRSRSPEASRALADACVDVLILVSLPEARWPLFAVPVRLSNELALQVHPVLLDHIGWEHLGSRVCIFSILSTEATNEARELLIPSRLQATGNPPAELPEMDRSAILDLTRDNLADIAALCALDDLPLRLTGWDRLFLGDADWLTG